MRDAALAEARARQRAAGQKVSRLHRAGVNTAGIDPRSPAAALQGMSTRQLRAYVAKLNRFTDRGTSYVAGLHGTPLSGNLWHRYQRAERIYNAKSAEFTQGIMGLTIPTTGGTVAEYLADRRSSIRAGDYRTFGALERTAANITSDKSLATLLRNMERRAQPGYLEQEAALQRRILSKMLKRTSNKDLIPAIRGMSDEEVLVMTQYTDFMSTLEGSYAMSKSTSTDRPRWQSSVYEDNEEDIRELIDWAHNHFTKKDETEQDSDDTRPAAPRRDYYGRFVARGKQNPTPQFERDERGRFRRRT